MTVREDKMGQSWLFPPCISDFVPADHICNLVVAVVSCIDVREIEARYIQVRAGQSGVSAPDAASTPGTGGY